MASNPHDQDDPLTAVLRELSRIAEAVESARAAEDKAIIEALREEVAELRAAVAHLRGTSRTPVPPSLRPVIARALLPDIPRPRTTAG